MKATTLFSLLVLITPLTAQNAAPAEGKDAAPAATRELMPNQKAFLNLPEESRKEFIKNLSDASRFFGDKRIFETLDALDKAEKVFADSPEIHNLRGSCYVEMRAFDKALSEFEKAKSFTKVNPSVDFNIAEVYFVTKEWKKALAMLEGILVSLPPEGSPLGRLIEFKILLCKLKLGMKDDVTILAEKYDFLDDSPYYYFAQATLAYEKNDMVKAEEWLGIASRVFQDPAVLAPWQDTLVEYGYIKSFYGDDPAAAPEGK